MTTIIKIKTNYMDEQSINGYDNNGKIYGIYYYEVANEDVGTDNQFNSDILEVEWYESEEERDKVFSHYENYITCDNCCYDILDDDGNVMEHECII